MKAKSTMMFILILTLIAIAFISSSDAAGYREMKSRASSGESRTFDSFMQTIDEEPKPEENRQMESDYKDLLQSYDSQSKRNPIDGILSIYPVAGIDEIIKLKGLEESDVMNRIKQGISDREILAIVAARSKRISNAENSWKAALNLYPQTVFLQNLFERYMSFSKSMTIGVGKEYQNEMIQMYYPSPGMLSLRGKAVELDVESAWLDYLKEVRDTLSDSKMLLAEIQNMDEMISINIQSESLLANLKDVAQAQYESGTRSFADIVRLKTELEKRRDTVERLETMRAGQIANLMASMNLPTDLENVKISWTMNRESELDNVMLADNLLKTRQELRKMALQLEKMDTMIAMSGIESVPDKTFGFSYFQNRNSGIQDAGMSTNESGGIVDDKNMDEISSMSFMNNPMVDHRDSRFGQSFTWITELVDRRAAMADMLKADTDMSQGMLRMRIREYEQMLESEKRYSRRIIPDADAALKVVRSGYSSGENDFNDFINAEMTFLMARMELTDIVLQKNQALIETERLVGYELEKIES